MAKPATIEELFQQIEQAVNDLEGGELPLEESLARFESGLKAMRHARGLLDRYAARLEELRGEQQQPEA